MNISPAQGEQKRRTHHEHPPQKTVHKLYPRPPRAQHHCSSFVAYKRAPGSRAGSRALSRWPLATCLARNKQANCEKQKPYIIHIYVCLHVAVTCGVCMSQRRDRSMVRSTNSPSSLSCATKNQAGNFRQEVKTQSGHVATLLLTIMKIGERANINIHIQQLGTTTIYVDHLQ